MNITTNTQRIKTIAWVECASPISKLLKGAAVMILPALVACGGGGGADGATSSAADPIASTPVNPPTPIVVNSTAELPVAEGFNLSTQTDLALAVNLAQLNSHRGYLSVCTDFEVTNGDVNYVNYDSCLLRTWVEDSDYTQSLTVTNDTQTLIAAVWYPELASVEYSQWHRDNGMQWVVN